MTFNSIDEYEQYMEQVNEEQWEKQAMEAQKQEEFNELMDAMNEEIYQRTGIKQKETGAVDKAVNQPNHYQFCDMTVNDLIRKAFTHEEYMGWLKGNCIKYRMRAFKKGKSGPQDIAKADEYEKFYTEYLVKNRPHNK